MNRLTTPPTPRCTGEAFLPQSKRPTQSNLATTLWEGRKKSAFHPSAFGNEQLCGSHNLIPGCVKQSTAGYCLHCHLRIWLLSVGA